MKLPKALSFFRAEQMPLQTLALRCDYFVMMILILLLSKLVSLQFPLKKCTRIRVRHFWQPSMN